MALAANPISSFQWLVPMVLGMISEMIRISKVIRALTRPNHCEPKSRVACRPTPAAPMVFAMVLSDRMAAMGREESVLNRFIRLAGLYPSSSRIVM